jgi:hypothetical protein
MSATMRLEESGVKIFDEAQIWQYFEASFPLLQSRNAKWEENLTDVEIKEIWSPGLSEGFPALNQRFQLLHPQLHTLMFDDKNKMSDGTTVDKYVSRNYDTFDKRHNEFMEELQTDFLNRHDLKVIIFPPTITMRNETHRTTSGRIPGYRSPVRKPIKPIERFIWPVKMWTEKEVTELFEESLQRLKVEDLKVIERIVAKPMRYHYDEQDLENMFPDFTFDMHGSFNNLRRFGTHNKMINDGGLMNDFVTEHLDDYKKLHNDQMQEMRSRVSEIQEDAEAEASARSRMCAIS